MKKLLTLFIMLLLLGSAVFLWWNNGLQAVNNNDQTQKIFVIDKGQGIREIASNLKEEGLIKDSVVFFLLVKQLGLDGKIQAGDFRLSPSMTTEQVAENLTHGSIDVWVTIPEGRRAEEIADILQNTMETYDPTWRKELNKHEGYLFPDTYLIPKDADIAMIIQIMRNNFENKYQEVDTAKTSLSKEDIVIIASLIEREARHDADRPKVASVIHNRLNIDMKLDIDATLQYVLGYQEDEKRWWKKGLTNDDKETKSPYNTYRYAGLPPAPIANPGIKSLQAAANPDKTNYLYYITDRNGINRYATTFEGHNANISRYGL